MGSEQDMQNMLASLLNSLPAEEGAGGSAGAGSFPNLGEINQMMRARKVIVDEMLDENAASRALRNSKGLDIPEESRKYELTKKILQCISRDDDGKIQELMRETHIDARDKKGRTALMLAAKEGSLKCARTLVLCGADILLTDPKQRNAYDVAKVSDQLQLRQFLAPLTDGAEEKARANTGRELSESMRAAIDADDYERVKELISSGQHVEARAVRGPRPGAGCTGLFLAVRECSPRAVQAFIEAGAQVDVDGGDGVTPLIHACTHAQHPHPKTMDIIRQLLAAGADPRRRSTDGETDALLVAQNNACKEVQELLRDAQKSLKGKDYAADPFVCANCGSAGQMSGLMKCGKCKMVRYCCRDCQLAHWKMHKPVCRAPPKAEEAHT